MTGKSDSFPEYTTLLMSQIMKQQTYRSNILNVFSLVLLFEGLECDAKTKERTTRLHLF